MSLDSTAARVSARAHTCPGTQAHRVRVPDRGRPQLPHRARGVLTAGPQDQYKAVSAVWCTADLGGPWGHRSVANRSRAFLS